MLARRQVFTAQSGAEHAAARRIKAAAQALGRGDLGVFVTGYDIPSGWETRTCGGVAVQTQANAVGDSKAARGAGHKVFLADRS